jgi:hypothetical protein
MAYLYLILPLAFQVICVIHVIRTGRDRSWIWAIVFLSLLGCIVYAIIEILPDLFSRRRTRQLAAGVGRVLNPGGKISKLQAELDFSPTVENRMALAEAWEEAGDNQKAAEHWEKCLEGIHADDIHIMGRLGRALHGCGQNVRARQWYEKIRARRGGFIEDRDTLCYAEVLESMGENAKAEEMYRSAAAGPIGFEAQYRFASFLRRTGRRKEADRAVSSLATAFDHLPPYARRAERRWVDAARREMTQ